MFVICTVHPYHVIQCLCTHKNAHNDYNLLTLSPLISAVIGMIRQRYCTSAWKKEMWFLRSNTTLGVCNVISNTYRGWRRTPNTETSTVSFLTSEHTNDHWIMIRKEHLHKILLYDMQTIQVCCSISSLTPDPS